MLAALITLLAVSPMAVRGAAMTNRTCPDHPCENGWEGSEDVGACYYFDPSPPRLTWAPAATSYCPSVRRGSFLAEVRTRGQHDFLVDKLGTDGLNRPSIWLGASELQTPGTYRWSRGGLIGSDEGFWASGEPHQKGSDACVGMWSEQKYKYKDFSCEDQHIPLCQYNL